jgi:hypothetical protein
MITKETKGRPVNNLEHSDENGTLRNNQKHGELSGRKEYKGNSSHSHSEMGHDSS